MENLAEHLRLLSGNELLKDILRVLETFGQFSTGGYQLVVKKVCTPIALLVNVSDIALVRRKEKLRLIVKYNLDGKVTKTEKDRMLGAHPLFQVDKLGILNEVSSRRRTLVVRLFLLLDKVVTEVIQKSHLLVQALRVGLKSMHVAQRLGSY